MAKRRNKKSSSPPAAKIVAAFTEADEAFFEAGASYDQLAPVESFDDLDTAQPKVGFWRRLFSRAA